MTTTQPADHEVRTRIRTSHAETLFVVAGAGTGKTTALVDRIVALVATGRSDLRDLAAITFTEAAAGELRDRVRTSLDRAANGDDPLVDTQEARERCAAARLVVDDAALSTLHAFAQRIIATSPLDVGVPPRFGVVDEIQAAVTFDRRWGRLLDEVLDDPDLEPAFTQSFVIGVRLSHWRRIAEGLHAEWDRLPTPPYPTGTGPLPAVDAGPLIEAIEAVLALRDHCEAHDDKLLLKFADYEPVLRALRTATDLDLLELVAMVSLPSPGKSGRKENWSIAKEVVAERMQAVATARDQLVRAQTHAIFERIAPQLYAWCLEGAEERAHAGELEFHDLLVRARNLLRSSARAHQAIASRYQFLLIDEFQDTDPLQIELAMLLAATIAPNDLDAVAGTDGTGATLPWPDIATGPGRLFFVGDPKQSIYRFRRADLDLYHRAETVFADGVVALTENFRSVPPIIEWVNAVFERLLTETAGEGIQAVPMDLSAHRGRLDGIGPSVATFGARSPDTAATVRLREAADIAAIVTEAVGNWTVLDEATHRARPARLNDIAVLLPTRAALDEIDRAFDAAAITARIESRSLVFATSEVRAITAVLEAIHDPSDSIAVVAALRAPGCGCSDRDLAQWSLAGGSWDFRAPVPDGVEADHPVAVALHRLAELHEHRWWRSVSETILATIDLLRLDVFAAEHRRPRDRWRRTRFLLHHARVWDDTAASSGLGGFLSWVRQQSDEGASAVEVPVPEHDDDAVRVLTVHGSKGLEFPIVILAGVGAAPATRYPAVRFGPNGPTFTAGSGETRVSTGDYSDLHVREAAHERAERARLLYVATTRARDHLVVSRHHTERAAKSPAGLLEPHIGFGQAQHLDPTTFAAREVPAPPPPQPAPFTTFAEVTAEFDRRRTVLTHAARPAAHSATSIARDLTAATTSDGDADVGTEGVDERPPWQRGRAGSALGRAVHAVLQFCDLDAGTDVARLAEVHAAAEFIPGRGAEVAALVDGIRATAIVRSAVAGRHLREVPVAASIEHSTIEGYIDLLVDDGDRLTVVDYKTDSLRDDDSIDAAVERYTPQAAAYALAVEAALGRPVERAVFVFGRPEGAVERDVPDLAGAKAEVRAWLEAAGA